MSRLIFRFTRGKDVERPLERYPETATRIILLATAFTIVSEPPRESFSVITPLVTPRRGRRPMPDRLIFWYTTPSTWWIWILDGRWSSATNYGRPSSQTINALILLCLIFMSTRSCSLKNVRTKRWFFYKMKKMMQLILTEHSETGLSKLKSFYRRKLRVRMCIEMWFFWKSRERKKATMIWWF